MKVGGMILGVIALVIGLAVILTIPVYYLWNWLCPDLFNLPRVTFAQAWGLLVLCGFLFKSSSSSNSN